MSACNIACFFVVFLTLPKISQCACHGSKTSYRAEFSGQLTVDNRVLLDHVIATFTVTSFTECFTHCDDDCRCRSFNLPMFGQGNCELNSADNSTVLTKPRHGWRYHHLQVKEVLRGADTCYEPYSNGCCKTNPCANNATCTELGDRGKPGFDCTCANEYHTGPMCEREINSCLDYLWHDKTASSGYYDIWEKDTLLKSRVYCDMRPDDIEAWTLVMSYGKANAGEFEEWSFYEDFPRNEIDADSGNYRLSLEGMQSIKTGISAHGRTVEWKASCGYSFKNGHSTSEDVVRSSFDTLNLLEFTTHEVGLVGYYPFDNVTRGEDKSGFGNHATMHDIEYEDGPLENPGGSARMNGSQSSYIELHDNSGKLDTKYRLTIMMQVYPLVTNDALLLGWHTVQKWGVRLWAFGQDIYFSPHNRDGVGIRNLRATGHIKRNQWNYLTATYDYDNDRESLYKNGQRVQRTGFVAQELGTESGLTLTIGAIAGDNRLYNGRVACLKIYNTAFTDEEVKAFTENWECPHEPAPICHRVDYIKIRDRECYNCNVWATQTNTEIFSINAYRGDQKCNFNSGSTVPDENIFGVYKVADGTSHACVASNDATTQYWFGGRL